MGKKHEFYFKRPDDERCYELDSIIDDDEYEGLTEIKLWEAIPYKVIGVFWCHAVYEPTTDSDNPCGRHCDDYAPRNGRSGICKHKDRRFYRPGKEFIYNVSGGNAL